MFTQITTHTMNDTELEFKKRLEALIKTTPKSVLADHFGISRQALYKWLRKYDIDYIEVKKKTGAKRIEELNELAGKLLNK